MRVARRRGESVFRENPEIKEKIISAIVKTSGGQTFKIRFSDFPCETFRVLKEKEEKQFSEYRTRRLILEASNAMERGPEPVKQKVSR